MAENTQPELRDPVAQDSKLVGDSAVNSETHEVTPEVTVEQVDAQVAPERQAADTKVNVHETVVATDVVITDPSSPLAVQVPDAGRGSLELPAHALSAPTPEQAFADAAPKASKPVAKPAAKANDDK